MSRSLMGGATRSGLARPLQLIGPEEDPQLALCLLDRLGNMHAVACGAEREVAPNRAWRGVVRVWAPHRVLQRTNRIPSTQHDDNSRLSQVRLGQFMVERPVLIAGQQLLHLLLCRHQHPHAADREATPFDAFDYLRRECSLQRVVFNNEDSAVHDIQRWCTHLWRPRGESVKPQP